MDWSVEAAVIALALIGQENGEAEAEIVALYKDLLRNAPRSGYTCYLDTLLWASLQLPHLPPKERSEIQQRLRSL